MELILLIGLPASGKSTFYREHFAQTHRLISKDLLRNNRRKNRRQRKLLEEAFSENCPVVLDNTHPSRADRAPWLAWAREKNWKTVGYYLSASLEQCQLRNQRRSSKERVPDVGFYTILKNLERPSHGEGFDQLYFVSQQDGETIIEDWSDHEV